MQYLGGKARIAKKLTAAIREIVGDAKIWEPFCGGLNLTEHLKPAVASDIDVSMISLVKAVMGGWDPPEFVDEATYRFARTLPEENPLHGFCAFGCSFGGKKWGGYARCQRGDNYAKQSARNVRRIARKLAVCDMAVLVADFLSSKFSADAIYCDPPYRAATGYARQFDHAAFDARCQALANGGRIVLVSEYTRPSNNARLVWELERNAELRGEAKTHIERLFLIEPE